MSEFDVLIVGAGPAGSVLGLHLARSGCSVGLLEATEYSRFRPGESLPPAVAPRLEQLRLAERFAASPAATVYGVASAWGSDQLGSTSFAINPNGHGWHVDRCAFDAMLSKAAEDAGAAVFRQTRAHAIEGGGKRPWVVTARSAQEERRFRTPFLVDGSGRSARVATRLQVPRRRLDHLVAVCVIYSSSHSTDVPHSLVETHPLGWWYSAGLPSGELVVMFYTDSDICAHRKVSLPTVWQQLLSETKHTSRRVADGGSAAGAAQVFPVASHCLERVAGDGWLAVGDAAIARDPLSSSGVDFALASATRAFSALYGRATGDRESLASYQSSIEQDFSAYVEQRAAFYRMEQRWPDTPFWSRRLTR